MTARNRADHWWLATPPLRRLLPGGKIGVSAVLNAHVHDRRNEAGCQVAAARAAGDATLPLEGGLTSRKRGLNIGRQFYGPIMAFYDLKTCFESSGAVGLFPSRDFPMAFDRLSPGLHF